MNREHSLGSSGAEDNGFPGSKPQSSIGANSVIGGQLSSKPSGYVSGNVGTDTESARLSNVQPYKYNTLNRANLDAHAMNIRKISPGIGSNAPLPLSRNGPRNMAAIIGRESNPKSNVGSVVSGVSGVLGDYAEGSGSILSGASMPTATNTALLPDISNKREGSKGRHRGDGAKLRQASPEAIALMMSSKNKTK